MARKPLRIEIPKNPDACIALAAKVLEKHLADGAASPLVGLGMTDMATKNSTAKSEHDLSKKLARDSETATENRDKALGTDTSTDGTVRFYLTAVRDSLLGKYRGNEQTLGDWGFGVDTSPKAAKPKTNS